MALISIVAGILAVIALSKISALQQRLDALELDMKSKRRRLGLDTPPSAAVTGAERLTEASAEGSPQPTSTRAQGLSGEFLAATSIEASSDTGGHHPSDGIEPSGEPHQEHADREEASTSEEAAEREDAGADETDGLDTPQERDARRTPSRGQRRAALGSDRSSPAGTVSGAESWERWLGVRGAALVGGVALVFAGIFFVQVAIQRGWLNPATRDTIAVVAGIVGLTLHAPLIRRGNRILGESISGAGTVLILGGAWAAAQLHDLIPHGLALLIMGGGVGAALLMAVRSSSKVLTGFALIGGYATPLLLDTAATSTFPLLGFLLVLNLGLLAAMRVTRWSWMGLGATLGTFLVQYIWLQLNEAPGGPWSIVLSLGLFPLLFSAVLRAAPGRSSELPPASLLALLAPAVITLLTTPEVTSTASLWPMTALMGALIVAARFILRSDRLTLATSITGGLTLTVIALRTRIALSGELTDWTWVQWAIGMCGISGSLLLLALRAGSDRRKDLSLPSFAVASIALLAAPAVGWQPQWLDLPIPFTVGVLSMGVIAGASALMMNGVRYALLAGTLTGLAASFISLMLDHECLRPDSPPLLAGFALAAAALVLGRMRPDRRDAAGALAASFPVVPLVLLVLTRNTYESPAITAALVAVSALGLATALRNRWVFVVAGLVAGATALDLTGYLGLSPRWGEASMVLPVLSFCVIAGSLPLAALWQREESGQKGEAFGLISALPALALALAASRSEWLTEAAGLTILGLDGRLVTLFSAAGALHLARRLAKGHAASPRARAVIDAATVTLAWCGLAQLVSFDWPTTSLAGAAAAFTYFTGRAKGHTVAIIAGTTLGAAGAGLIFSTYVLDTFSREPLLIPLDVTIDHALVAAALFGGLRGLTRSGTTRELSAVRVGLASTLLGVTFSWINAVILNYFSTSDVITLDVERMQSRDLTMSFAWTAFAIFLLIAGLRRQVSGLRWASLIVLVATVLKVFLYDLGALEGLARVGSFLGLAICLLGVSLLYGRVLGQDSGRGGPRGDNLLPHDDDEPTPDA
ncbi:DUF2339 domain-containing protein [bacterium]|nr:DUF2339 domain-containing protein [bacterium]